MASLQTEVHCHLIFKSYVWNLRTIYSIFYKNTEQRGTDIIHTVLVRINIYIKALFLSLYKRNGKRNMFD